MSELPTCPHCGHEMTPGGVALACGGGGKSWRIQLPPCCQNSECRRERDRQAIADAIVTGLIDP